MRILIVAMLLATSSSAGQITHPLLTHKTSDSHHGPVEWLNHNTSVSKAAMTEIRAMNDAGCAMDLGVVSSSYSADSSIQANEAFLVSESSCEGMTIKANGPESYIRFSVETTEHARIHGNGSIELSKSKDCPSEDHPEKGGFLCVSTDGALWYKGPSGRRTRLALP